jgi:hypothetical protein
MAVDDVAGATGLPSVSPEERAQARARLTESFDARFRL